ncbi:MAG TPA: type II toxin-antitoxin system VapC family toxin [Phycisphaerae bacterium]|jgi:tRNA(fMet)-specific endonuclease VapC|nr:type II toxin-antitoxin system VapC family toxin [Phycisphaerae bacterium]HOB73032.1 type II toxin-antitoxin system VapC family toxin [Phycisphaerae bacterium]HOJ52919.1 type II toxin-antitoxin system VapC family toxin [Phycisphaerae bacterium]HOL24655.1 type II toxin-antitoxin system VapC family toxin [Phycisphaerae bacterium]HPP19192.1 type II toxin-antitoxin system VapC family toxin [Phycisphaerae bacterium]
MSEALLDTSTFSEILKRRNRVITRRSLDYLAEYGVFQISLITRYAILRGLKAKGAHQQIAEFERTCRRHRVLPVSDRVIVVAADLYANLRKQGQLIGDADLLIAATALIHRLSLVTGNTVHFNRIPGLRLENWMQ